MRGRRCRRGWWALAVLGAWTVVVVAAHMHAANVGYVPWMPKQGGPEYPTPSAVQSRAAAVEAVVWMACLLISLAATLLVAGSSSETRAEWSFLRGPPCWRWLPARRPPCWGSSACGSWSSSPELLWLRAPGVCCCPAGHRHRSASDRSLNRRITLQGFAAPDSGSFNELGPQSPERYPWLDP